MTTNVSTSNGSTKPFVRIIEQPAKCAIRFRYECEGRSAGSIPGINSTPENKTFPTIQVCNYRGKAVVVVSCVTKEPPYRPHPHNLVGKEGCKKGVCTLVIDNNVDMICTFTSLGIQCVKRNKIEESLKLREMIKVDPFRTGFSHRNQTSSIDLNCLRLCFQVFIEGPEKGKFAVQLPPVISDAIYDKKAMAELIIAKLSHYSAPCTGGKEIILLCDRVAKDDIQVRFFQESEKGIVWEAFGEFSANDVHKQVAIALRTPRYYDETISQPVTVQMQLRRPSDCCLSMPRSFQITPREIDLDGLVRKRHKRLKEENYDLLREYIQLANKQQSTSICLDMVKSEIPTAQETSIAASSSSSAQISSLPTSAIISSQNFSDPSVALHHLEQKSPQSSLQHQHNLSNQKRSSANPPTFPSPIASPNVNTQNQEIPSEVMERFDSLDIDSSELIPDLDFNSNTMLSLMMDSSSGLSLNDSFSDITNNNNNIPTSNIPTSKTQDSQINGDNGNKSFNPYNNEQIRSKVKMNIPINEISDQNGHLNEDATASNISIMEMISNGNLLELGYDNRNLINNNSPIFMSLDADNNLNHLE
ncbi:embryonic polarity protein dorsal-like protein [Sarcoptes scabiei]|uniref:Embryonic polarity protein dorsal-like protein n=1 Tax=Sarcoptes scabiei TaxID=52283 RepID=A0A132AHS5_SARSC|nr:embryonic polarity protein dorsal-like protein [Sarcoptes scabiei]